MNIKIFKQEAFEKMKNKVKPKIITDYLILKEFIIPDVAWIIIENLFYHTNEYNKYVELINNIIYVKRIDLIENYLGCSAEKTKRFLEKNVDKMIIVTDKLMTSENDSFGYEIQATFNQQYPEIIKYLL